MKQYNVKKAIGIFLFLCLLSCHKDESGNGIDRVSNIKFKDFDNKSYEFTDFTNRNKGILLFGFAKWCGWSRMELKYINKIDSIYSDKIAIIGVDCENINDTVNVKYYWSNKYSVPLIKNRERFNKMRLCY